MNTGRSGRGPTMLISPLSTFQSCGSSSMRVFRMNRPTRVTRGSFSSANLAPRTSASTRIERNLFSMNARPNSPARSCR